MSQFLKSVDQFLGLPVNVVVAGVGIAVILAIGSTMRWIALRGAPPAERKDRLGSLVVWWAMLAIVVCTLMAGTVGGAVTFGIISFVALYEYFELLAKKSIDRTGRSLIFLTVPAAYACVVTDDCTGCQAFVFLAMTLAVTIALVLAGKTTGFVETASSQVWGALLFIFCLGHAAMLLALPAASNPVAGAQGWFVYLIVITQCDDIFQALWGRRFGRHKIAPVLSPNKTWEGFLLGGLTALGVGLLLARLLTPLADPWTLRIGTWVVRVPYLGAVLASVLLSLAGFFGDLTESAIKRDAGVKDSGKWLPGQGGILDRIDSLTFTAPVFYYFVQILYV